MKLKTIILLALLGGAVFLFWKSKEKSDSESGTGSGSSTGGSGSNTGSGSSTGSGSGTSTGSGTNVNTDTGINGINGTNQKPSSLTYPETQYLIFANEMHNLVLGLNGNKDNQLIEYVFKMYSFDDWNRLSVAYGTRRGVNGWNMYKTYTLQTMLRYELSTKAAKSANEHLKTFGVSI
jgi:hypothetical protein